MKKRNDDNPEMTDADFARAKPFKDVFPAQHAALKKARGRPPVESPKASLKIRIDADVLKWLKAGGRGYQTRLNAILRKEMERG